MELVTEEFDITEIIKVQFGYMEGVRNTTTECIVIADCGIKGEKHNMIVKTGKCAIWFNAIAKTMRDKNMGGSYHRIFTQLDSWIYDVRCDSYKGTPITTLFELIASIIVNHHEVNWVESLVIGSLDYMDNDILEEDEKLDLRNLYNYVDHYVYAYRVVIRKHDPVNSKDGTLYCIFAETYAKQNIKQRHFFSRDYHMVDSDTLDSHDSYELFDNFERMNRYAFDITSHFNIEGFVSYESACMRVANGLFDANIDPDWDEYDLHTWQQHAQNCFDTDVNKERYSALMHKYFIPDNYVYGIPDDYEQSPPLASFQFVNYV